MQVKPSDILKTAKKYIENPNNWIKNYYAVDKFGEIEEIDSENACSFCSMGALMRAENVDYNKKYVDEYIEAKRHLYKAARELDNFNDTVIAYNDEHNHEEVMEMFDRAIEIALRKEEN